MLKTPSAWLAALWVGSWFHLDWHLGRRHDHRSFDLWYHWLLAVPTFAPLAWFAHRRWPNEAFRAGVTIAGMGLLLGQGIEPLGEVMYVGADSEAFTNPTRWRIVAQFVGTGLLTLILGTALIARSRQRKHS